jgi:hypothetical protein
VAADPTFDPVRSRTPSGLVLALLAALTVPAVVAAVTASVDAPAVSSARAERVTPVATDTVNIFNVGDLRPEVISAAIRTARSSGASVAFGRSASVPMVGVYRGGAPVQLPPSGFAYPMGTTVLPIDAVAATMGRDVSAQLAPDALVMGQTTANLRGALPGDVVQLVAAPGWQLPFRIAAVLPDARIGGTELLVSSEAGDRLGITSLRRALLWNPSSRAAMDTALANNGLVSTSIRIRRSWDPPDPDDTLGMAATKLRLGEFAYRVNSDGSVSQDPGWVARSLPSARREIGLGIRARCHLAVEPALRDALSEIASRGLAGTIDVANANTYGGCHNARFNRLTPGSALGFLSRHSWAMALDVNTVGSCQGCAPPDFATRPGGCTTVQIFRKRGFSWGGNYLTPDGMHFEWVGERRDLLPYPSRWCRNTGVVALTTAEAGIDTFFADDGLIDQEPHDHSHDEPHPDTHDEPHLDTDVEPDDHPHEEQ